MNAPQFWNDHTFRVLLDDLFRARKDNSLGPIRLHAILDYAQRNSDVPPVSAFNPLLQKVDPWPTPDPALASSAPTAGFLLEDSEDEALAPPIPVMPPSPKPKRKYQRHAKPEIEPVPEPKAKGRRKKTSEPNAPPISYLEARRAERKDPHASLKAAADLVQEAIKAGRWGADGSMMVNIPRTYVVAGLEAILKERRVPFSSLTVSLPPKQQKIDINSASAKSGAIGERTDGWAVILTK